MSTASQKRRKERLRKGEIKPPPKPPKLTLERRRIAMGKGPKPGWNLFSRSSREDGTAATKPPMWKRKKKRKQAR